MQPKQADELSCAHEALIELLHGMTRAGLLAIICPLIDLEPGDVAELRPFLGTVSLPGLYGKARRAYPDLVVELRTHGGARIRVVILEVQLSVDIQKKKVWPLLEIGIHTGSSVDTRLLLLTPDPELRARITRVVLSRMRTSPIFIGADQIPFICDYTQARAKPHETILGAAFHSREAESPSRSVSDKIAALRAAFVALETFDALTSLRFQAIIMSIAPAHLVTPALEDLRQTGEITESRYELFTEVERGGHSFHRGREEGLRLMLVSVLEQRFGPLDAERLEALAQASSAELERLGSRVVTAPSLDALFA